MTDVDPRLRVAELAEAGLAAASLVHELRQPLFTIKALAQLGDAGNGVQGSDLADLLAAVGHMEALLDVWNDVGRSDPPVPYDLVPISARAVRMLERQLSKAGVVVRLPSVDRLIVHGPPSDARQILLNLLQNALDAVVDSPRREIHLDYFERDGLVGIRVTDFGPGLAPGEPVFEPFYTTKGARGTGLGLHVTRTLCERMGGELLLQSDELGTHAEARFVPRA